MCTRIASRRTVAVIVALLGWSGAARASEVTIAPIVEPRARLEVADDMAHAAIDRTSARDLGRLVLEESTTAQASTVGGETVQELALPLPLSFDGDDRVAKGSMSLARIRLDGAAGARLRFKGLADGTVLWLAGSADDTFIRYEPSPRSPWGPATRGSEIFVAGESLDEGEVDAIVPIAATSFAADVTTTATSTACLTDVACPAASAAFGALGDAMRAVAYLRIVREGKAFVCSGALIADASQSRTPYFLTARHCVPDSAAAASVEIIWDLRSSACGSNQMEKYERTYGATLLVASEQTDVALLRLNTPPPAGRVFLGIETRRLAAGQVVHHVSHAYGLAQTYASSVVTESGSTCGTAQRPRFVYSEPRLGGIANGSSGAPMLVDGLYVAGQLLGLCGADPTNPCATFNDLVDGSIRESWPLLAPFLGNTPTIAPPATAAPVTSRRRGAGH